MVSKLINNLLKRFGIQLKKVKALDAERKYYVNIINGAAVIFNTHLKYKDKELNKQLSGLVFSKDRAMQLHALLTSYVEKVAHFCPLSILYKATSVQSQKAYDMLEIEFKRYSVRFIQEDRFDVQVKNWLTNEPADRIFFMTDDAVLLDSFDMNDALLFNPLNEILSLTKGNDLQYCFTMDTKQELPVFERVTKQPGKIFNVWKWEDCKESPDWIYPLSVDGTFFLREEMLRLIENITFKNPNSLEANMQVYISFFVQRKGICYDKVKMINVPCNLVQNDFQNRFTGFFTAEKLQSMWDEGKRIDVKGFYGLDAFEAEHKKYDFVRQ